MARRRHSPERAGCRETPGRTRGLCDSEANASGCASSPGHASRLCLPRWPAVGPFARWEAAGRHYLRPRGEESSRQRGDRAICSAVRL